jgi:hypothetical protein
MKDYGISNRPDAADSGRRSFILKMGVGMSTAAAAGIAMARPAGGDDAVLRAARLEEEGRLRRLLAAFQEAVDRRRHDEVIALFTADAEVHFNGGIFRGRDRGVARFFRQHLPARKAGTSMPAAPGFELTPSQRREQVQVAADLASATAVFPYSIQAGMPLESECSLASMARLHGEGVRTWWEGGHYRIAYVKDSADGRWKIARLQYDTLVRADWRTGRSYATAIEVPRLARCHPADADGPDALV